MIDVLHVSAMGERGGLEVVLLNLLKRLDRERFRPHVAFLSDGPFVAEVQRQGIDTHVVAAGRVRELISGARGIKAIADLIRKRQIAVVHTWNHKAHLYGGIAAAWVGAKTVYHLEVVPRPGLSRDGLVASISLWVPAEATVACSQFVAREFRDLWHLRRKIDVVYNGTDPAICEETTGVSLSQRLGVPEDCQLVVMPTRLQRGKGVHVLLEAAARILSRRSGVLFLIVGGALFGLEQEYVAELEQRVEALGVGHAVRFVGFQSNVMPFLAGSDLVVHCSVESEAFGMVLVEAMACGRAVIATRSGGPEEIVEDGVTGVLVLPNNADQLAGAIFDLLIDDERRRQMGVAGQARVRALFTAERMARQVEGVYETVASTWPGG